jgi:hypothetical protein
MDRLMKKLITLLCLICPVAFATTYSIGPGKTYTNIGDAPWSSMASGDTVLIYPKTLINVVTAGPVSTPTFVATLTSGSYNFTFVSGTTPWVGEGITGTGLSTTGHGSYVTAYNYSTGVGTFSNYQGKAATVSANETLTGYGSVLTLTSLASSIPFGSEVYYGSPVCSAANQLNCAKPVIVTCGVEGSGLYRTATGGVACPRSTITVEYPVSIPSGTTLYILPPYFEKIIITQPGTTVRGVPDATTGLNPILDPDYATTGPNMAHCGSVASRDAYGAVIEGEWNRNCATMPIGNTLENLTVSHTWAGVSMYDGTNTLYTVKDGYATRFDAWANSTIKGVSFIYNNLGLFMADYSEIAQPDVVYHNALIGNYFYQNGLGTGSHQSYVESTIPYGTSEYGAFYKGNWYDAPFFWGVNSQIKDRSTGTVILYNHFAAGGYANDIVAAQNSFYDAVHGVGLLVPSGGFASGATTLTFAPPASFSCSVKAGSRMVIANGKVLPSPNFSTAFFAGNGIQAPELPVGTINVVNLSGVTRLNQAATATNPASTCTYGSIQGASVGDRVCYFNTASGGSSWGYPGSGHLTCPAVSGVDTSTNTITLSGAGLPAALSPGNIVYIVSQKPYPYKQVFIGGNVYDYNQADKGGKATSLPAMIHCCHDEGSGTVNDWIGDRAASIFVYDNTFVAKYDRSVSYGDAFLTSESDSENWVLSNNLLYITNSTTGQTPSYWLLVSQGGYTLSGAASATLSGNSTQIGTSTGIGSTTQCGVTWAGVQPCRVPPDPDSNIVLTSGFTLESPANLYPSGPGSYPFALQAGSSAIGAGSALPASVTSNTMNGDFTPYFNADGSARTSLSDIGATQYGRDVPSTTIGGMIIR